MPFAISQFLFEIRINSYLYESVLLPLDEGVKRAISPVIATVILVAVAVSIAIAVTFWQASILGTFTRFEEVQIDYSYATVNGTLSNQTIVIGYRNAGSADVTFQDIFVDNKPIRDYYPNYRVYDSLSSGHDLTPLVGGQGIPVRAGKSIILVFVFKSNSFIHGQAVDIRINTVSGIYYSKIMMP